AYVAGKLTTIPLDIDTTTVAKSEKVADSQADAEFPAKSLDMCSIDKGKAVVNEVSVTTQTRTLVTTPSDKSTMTVQSGSSMVVPSIKTKGEPRHPELTGAVQDKRPCDDGLVQAWLDRVSLDR
ncbi:porin PorA family protein, partial [Mycobacterium kansasii]